MPRTVPVTEGRIKPLASITFGRVMRQLRRRVARLMNSTDRAAKVLGIGGSTLRLLEAGNVVPMATLAVPMAHYYRTSFSSTSVIISFVLYIDRQHSYTNVASEAKEIVRSTPSIEFFADAVVKAAELAGSGKQDVAFAILRDPGLVNELQSFLEQPFRERLEGFVVSKSALNDAALDDSTIQLLQQLLTHKRTIV